MPSVQLIRSCSTRSDSVMLNVKLSSVVDVHGVASGPWALSSSKSGMSMSTGWPSSLWWVDSGVSLGESVVIVSYIAAGGWHRCMTSSSICCCVHDFLRASWQGFLGFLCGAARDVLDGVGACVTGVAGGSDGGRLRSGLSETGSHCLTSWCGWIVQWLHVMALVWSGWSSSRMQTRRPVSLRLTFGAVRCTASTCTLIVAPHHVRVEPTSASAREALRSGVRASERCRTWCGCGSW